MIAVVRLPQPVCLGSTVTTKATSRLCSRRAKYWRHLSDYRAGRRTNEPSRPKADSKRYAHPQVRAQLEAMFGTKCAYCETEVRASGPQHIEHYRPAARYPALAYEWGNLLLACAECNVAYKSDRFPVAPSGNTPRENRRSPEARTGTGETPLLLNPCNDSPDAHFTYRAGRVVTLTHRGRVTRRICGLNRDFLVRDRRNHLKYVQLLLDSYQKAVRIGDARQYIYRQDLSDVTSRTAKYAAMVRTELGTRGIDWRTL